MRSNPSLLALPLVLSACSCPGPPTDTAETRLSIMAANAMFAAAAKESEAARIAHEYYTGDAVVLFPGHDAIVGLEHIYLFFRPLFESGITEFVLQTDRVERSGDLAYEFGRYELPLGQGTRQVKDRGRYVFLWKREENGEWLAHVHCFNSSLPAASTEDPAQDR